MTLTLTARAQGCDITDGPEVDEDSSTAVNEDSEDEVESDMGNDDGIVNSSMQNQKS